MNYMRCLISKKIVLAVAITLALGTVQAQEKKDTLRLTLDQVLEIALSDNPTIKVADQEIELKKTANKEAYAGLFPEASLNGAYSRAIKKQAMVMKIPDQEPMRIEMGSDNTYDGGLNINLPLFAPALYKSISLTKTDVDLAVEKSRSSKIDMINQVTKSYYQLLLAQDSYKVLQMSYEQAQANFNIVKAKFEQGVVSEYDKIRADVQVRNIKPLVISAKNGVNLAQLYLKVLMGMDVAQEYTVVGSLKDYEAQMFGQLLSDDQINLTSNSDLKQLDLNAQLLEKTLKLQKTNFMPTLGASFNYSYMSLNDNFNIGHYDWTPYSSLGLSLSIPLFRASNFTTMKKTRIQMRQLAETRANTERQLSTLAIGYKDSMTASSEQALSSKEGVSQAEKGREIAEKRYEVGKGTVLELTDSEVALTQAKLAYHQSIYNYLEAKADLDKVLGSQWMK